MKNIWLVLFVCSLTLITVTPQYSRAQLDTVGFPLDIGNKWYYHYRSDFHPSSVIVKTIVDTGSDGQRLVRITELGHDSTIGNETWAVRNGSFYVNGVCLYDSSLTHDSSYYYSGTGVYQLSIQLTRVNLFDQDVKCQIRSTYELYAGGWGWTDKRVGLGIGYYYDYAHGFAYESGYDWTNELIGFIRNGVLFGDTSLTSARTTPSSDILSYGLYQNYPNPFNPTTTIEYELPAQGHVTLKVFNVLGQEVAVLVDDVQSAGFKTVEFNAADLPSGVYLYRLTAGEYDVARKLVVLR